MPDLTRHLIAKVDTAISDAGWETDADPHSKTSQPYTLGRHTEMPDDLKDEVSQFIKAARGSTSQSAVARKIGVSPSMISQLENKRATHVSLATLDRIAKHFGKRLTLVLGD